MQRTEPAATIDHRYGDPEATATSPPTRTSY
jgi:hypothetical protein